MRRCTMNLGASGCWLGVPCASLYCRLFLSSFTAPGPQPTEVNKWCPNRDLKPPLRRDRQAFGTLKKVMDPVDQYGHLFGKSSPRLDISKIKKTPQPPQGLRTQSPVNKMAALTLKRPRKWKMAPIPLPTW
ncbi:uncharacterized protein LOC144617048 [Panthera onca]